MQKQFIISTIVFFLAVNVACKYFRPAQELESEKAKSNPNKTNTGSDIFLNMQPIGKASALKPSVRGQNSTVPADSPLRSKISEIIKDRTQNRVFVGESNQVANGVNVIAEKTMPVGEVARIAVTINDANGTALFPKPEEKIRPEIPSTEHLRSPLPTRMTSPIYLAVSANASNKNEPKWLVFDPKFLASYNITFALVTKDLELLKTRAFEGSIELSADERWFVNDPQGIEADEGPEHTQIKQRAVAKEELAKELEMLSKRNSTVTVVVNELASYGPLLHLIELADDAIIPLDIDVLVVNDNHSADWGN